MWILVFGLAVSVLPCVRGSIQSYREGRSARVANPSWPYRRAGHRVPLLARRITAERARRFLSFQWLLLGLMLVTLHWELWEAEDVGIRTDVSWPGALAYGVLMYAAFLLLARFAPLEPGGLGYLNLRRFTARNRDGRDVLCMALVLNPVTEEFWMRGVLVYHLGRVLGSAPLAIVVGFVACMLVHLYQGVGMLTWHAAFFFGAVIVLYGEFGLVGAIGFHLAGDLWPALTADRHLRAWQGHLRRAGLSRRPDEST
jgi:hypothetical protein